MLWFLLMLLDGALAAALHNITETSVSACHQAPAGSTLWPLAMLPLSIVPPVYYMYRRRKDESLELPLNVPCGIYPPLTTR